MPLISGRHNSPQLRSTAASVVGRVSPSLRPTISNSKKDKSGTSSPLFRLSPSSSPHLKAQISPRLSPAPASPPASLDLRIESPPLVLYGNAAESTGCLLSGIFDVVINQDAPFAMAKVDLVIYQEVRQKKPNPQKCDQCKVHTTELAKWNVLGHAAELPKGRHGYPFSHLIPGSVPATCDTLAYSVSYYLKAVAIPVNSSSGSVSSNHGNGAPIQLTLPLKLSRSVIKGPDRNSIRVFPPTDLTATVTMPSVAYPLSYFSFDLMLEGVTAHLKNRTAKWRMRKINWRVDQTIKMNWRVCDTHRPPPPAPPAPASTQQNAAEGGTNSPASGGTQVPGSSGTNSSPPVAAASGATRANPATPETAPRDHTHLSHDAANSNNRKGKHRIQQNDKNGYEEVVTISSGEFKEGWKSDFSDKGKIEFNTNEIGIPKDVCCKIEDPVFGLSASHVLVVELVIAEETQSSKSSRQTIPTGAARVLRMQFNLVITDRSGLGIAWDDEVPPIYGDVPLSPPDYDNVAELPKFEDLSPSITSVEGINSTFSLN